MGRKSEKTGCHRCRQCGTAFTRIQNLNRHQRNHDGVKRHTCSECGDGFSRADLLRRHQLRSHDGFVPKTPPKACKFCSTSKVRCDRQLPCSQCQSKGIICESRGSPSLGDVAPAHNLINHCTLSSMNTTASTLSFHLTVAGAIPTPVESALEPVLVDSTSPLSAMDLLGTLDDLSSSSVILPSLFDYNMSLGTSSLHHILDQYPDTFCVLGMESLPGFNSFPSNIEPLNPYFTPSMMELFLRLYMKHFNPHWPLVDPTTIPNEDPSAPLIMAMCCIGAAYDCQPESKRLAAAVVLEQRPALLSQTTAHYLKDDETLSTLQALLLYQIFGSFHEEDYHRSLSAMFHGSLVQLLRQSKWLERDSSICTFQNAAIQTQAFLARSRVVYGIYFLDMLQPILNGNPASLSVGEMSLQVTSDAGPSHSSSSLSSLFHQLLDPDQKVFINDKFEALLLLVALNGEIFDFLRLRHTMLVSSDGLAGIQPQKTKIRDQQSSRTRQTWQAVYDFFKLRQQLLEAAHSRWKGLWDSLDQVDADGTLWAYKNAIPFYVIGFLALSYSNSGMEWVHLTNRHDSDSTKLCGSGNSTFAQFCCSFRHCINEADWCGVPWLFPHT